MPQWIIKIQSILNHMMPHTHRFFHISAAFTLCLLWPSNAKKIRGRKAAWQIANAKFKLDEQLKDVEMIIKCIMHTP